MKENLAPEKPTQQLKNQGISSLTDSELLSILLRTGSKNESVDELATKILKEIGEDKTIENYKKIYEKYGIEDKERKIRNI